VHDAACAEVLLDGFQKGAVVIADKGYDADSIRAQGAVPNIPNRSNRKTKYRCTKALYRERNLVERFFNGLFVGVPDSVLGPLIEALEGREDLNHQIAACEGSAVSSAAGISMASGRPCCVYMQNSGLPNALNPLLSMFSRQVYDIPLILLAGWRGETGSTEWLPRSIGTPWRTYRRELSPIPMAPLWPQCRP